MTEMNQNKILNEINSILTDDGYVILSVPIETGLGGFLKNIARILLKQTHSNTSLKNIFKSAFNIKIDRGEEAYISSHIGFDYKKLEKLFKINGFKIISKSFSPLPIFRSVVNSQVFYYLKKI
jgi:hypothetical protein